MYSCLNGRYNQVYLGFMLVACKSVVFWGEGLNTLANPTVSRH